MMVKTMLPMAMLLALVLCALPAAAKDRSHDKREPKVEKVAHKLVRATHDLNAEARSRHSRSRSYRYTVAALNDLDRSASAFSHALERGGVYSPATRRAHLRLERAYETAVVRVDRMHRSQNLRNDVKRVGKLMQQLDTQLASYERRGEPQRRHARAVAPVWRGLFAWNF